MPFPPARKGDPFTAERYNSDLAPLDRMRVAGAEAGRAFVQPAAGSAQMWLLVVGEENDYLRCKRFTGVIEQIATAEIKVAKPQQMRGGSVLWGAYPAYLPDVSVIMAIPNGQSDVVDGDDTPIRWLDANIDGRRADGFWAKITGSSAQGSNKWRYAWTEMYQSGAETYSTLTGGRSGTTSTGYATNSKERSNTGSGVEGHGVDVDGADYPAGFSVQPIQGNPIVWMRQTQLTATTWAYAFTDVNADDGTCEAA